MFIWISAIPLVLFSSVKFKYNKIQNSSLRRIKESLRIKDSITVKLFCQFPPLPLALLYTYPSLCLVFSQPLSGFTVSCLCSWLSACLSIYTWLANPVSTWLSKTTHLSIYTLFPSLPSGLSATICLFFYACLPVYVYQLICKPSCLCQTAFWWFISCRTHLLSASLLSAYLASQAKSYTCIERNT